MAIYGTDRRHLGPAMFGFGLIGLVLAGIMAGALVAGGVTARSLDDRVAAGQERLAAAVEHASLAMDSLAAGIDNASGTLKTSTDSVVHTADLLGQVADTSDSLALSLNVDILGTRPFSAAALKLTNLTGQVRTLQGDATALAANLDANGRDVTQIAGQVRELRVDVGDLGAAIDSFSNTRELVALLAGGMVVALLMTVWLAVLAAGIAAAGWHLRRRKLTTG
jgi:outer membrane murein-binding lipoprotein Lpp